MGVAERMEFHGFTLCGAFGCVFGLGGGHFRLRSEVFFGCLNSNLGIMHDFNRLAGVLFIAVTQPASHCLRWRLSNQYASLK